MVDLGTMDYKDVTVLLELKSSNKDYKVLKFLFEEKTTGSMDAKMTTTSKLEVKQNEKYYEESEVIENSYVGGNMKLKSTSNIRTNLEWYGYATSRVVYELNTKGFQALALKITSEVRLCSVHIACLATKSAYISL